MTFESIPEEDRVFLIDVAAVKDTTFVTSAGYAEAPDAACSRLYLCFGDDEDDWASHDVPDDVIVSVAYRGGQLFALGKNGLVKFVGRPGQPFVFENVAGQFRSFVIDACEGKGHLTKVRATPSGFIACGWGGQVYRLDADGWASLTGRDAGLDRFDLLDVDSAVDGTLYAVGLGGALLRYDGQTWCREDLPTHRHFHAVRCLPDGRVVVAGAKGALYVGGRDAWREIDTQLDGNFWSIESFDGAVWLSHADRQLFRLVADTLQEVTLPAGARTYRLSAGPSHLLSCGSDALMRYDARGWAAVDCPDMR